MEWYIHWLLGGAYCCYGVGTYLGCYGENVVAMWWVHTLVAKESVLLLWSGTYIGCWGEHAVAIEGWVHTLVARESMLLLWGGYIPWLLGRACCCYGVVHTLVARESMFLL